MPLRTPQQYLDGLADEREVWFHGEQVRDVRTHPELRIGVETGYIDYVIAEDPACRDFAVAEDPDSGEISRFFWVPKSTADLLLRRRLIEEGCRRSAGVVPLIKDAGTDGLNALSVVAPKMDRTLGTDYAARVRAFQRHCQEKDLSLALAMTDPKGDRTLRPADQPQPDTYLHVVERRTDGIVVRGAKLHVSTAPYTDELLVLPTRAMTEPDADWAVAFAIPVSTPGIVVVSRSRPAYEGAGVAENPVSARYDLIEGTVIFDDVFVPYERVFHCGEWQWSGPICAMFANFHRFTAASYKYPALQLIAGCALLAAEVNGTERVAHVRDKITGLAVYAETTRALTYAAAMDPAIDEDTGTAIPSPLIGNLAKLYFAENYHLALRAVQDIAGGLLVTAPSLQDFEVPHLRRFLDVLLSGKAGTTGEERLKVMKLVRDVAASGFSSFWEVTTIHAEGSLAAERLFVQREAPLAGYRSLARHVAGLD